MANLLQPPAGDANIASRRLLRFLDDCMEHNDRLTRKNPKKYATDGTVGVLRPAGFDTQTQSAFVISEAATFNLGKPGHTFGRFTRMEGNPHGSAHTSFGGYMRDPTTAAKDPLFFLLHSNVDRLWAKWQWLHHRFDVTSTIGGLPFDFAGRAL